MHGSLIALLDIAWFSYCTI